MRGFILAVEKCYTARMSKPALQAQLADAVRSVLDRHQVNCFQLARAMGITEQYAWKLRQGARWPSAEMMLQLRRLGVSFDSILDSVELPEPIDWEFVRAERSAPRKKKTPPAS
jgi:transcriptional regulator with XRE-family HTH domain